MLEDLKVLNGNLELKYNEYTYEYTIRVKQDIKRLELEYKLKDDCYIEIIDNDLKNEENIVYLKVYNVDEEIIYKLYVYKEITNEVSGIDNFVESLEVNKNNDIPLYKVQILSISIFLIILILFSIMFKTKKVKLN